MTDFLKKYLTKLTSIGSSINADEFADLLKELKEAYFRDAQIFILGNGGSGSTASHFACDINKCASEGKEKRFKVISLADNIPTILAYANDMSYEDIFVEQLKNFLTPNDLVIGISGSGNSPNVLKAVKYANSKNAETFGLCGYSGGKLKEISNKSLVIHSNDMQKVEDLHFIILHAAMQYLHLNP